ncbi:hypothetical protein AV521_40745 [Streptomyces sp. IMTB 2501]|uniref:DUF7383 domain-containing protein n=1 Tax=Streptomyces sp. IMTB 2501 TaxID=1776340 RepID=UPI00096E46A1|nr:hypothetical protein [Streptomyces sp. IMTB 2501]OLZ62931.1 hypothetical protein AV521_40745 [Streptomyces sp. IMTB 2501]
MNTRADFRMIRFNQRIGARTPPSGFVAGSSRYVGTETTAEEFEIDTAPVGDGYLVMQVYGVNFTGHRVLINGRDLPDFDIAAGPQGQVLWQTWMDPIEEGILKQGSNTIQIQHGTTSSRRVDNFIVRDVVVHWREAADGGTQDGGDAQNQW